MKNGNGVGGGREARSGCVAEALERRQLLAASMAAFTIGGAGGDNARDVYADRRNGTYVAGDFTGRVDFQKGVGAHVVNAGSKADRSQRTIRLRRITRGFWLRTSTSRLMRLRSRMERTRSCW